MQPHRTVSVERDDGEKTVPWTKAVVLIGNPAVGKTTVANIIGDLDIATASIDEREASLDQLKAGLLDFLEETASPQYRRNICCFSGITSPELVTFLRTQTQTLVVRITATDDEWVERYIGRELTGEGLVAVPQDRIADLEAEAWERHDEESPLPEHDVSLDNSDDVSMAELTSRVTNLMQAVTPQDIDVETPRSVVN